MYVSSRFHQVPIIEEDIEKIASNSIGFLYCTGHFPKIDVHGLKKRELDQPCHLFVRRADL